MSIHNLRCSVQLSEIEKREEEKISLKNTSYPLKVPARLPVAKLLRLTWNSILIVYSTKNDNANVGIISIPWRRIKKEQCKVTVSLRRIREYGELKLYNWIHVCSGNDNQPCSTNTLQRFMLFSDANKLILALQSK